MLVLGELQTLVGKALAGYQNDRTADRSAVVVPPLEQAHQLCVDARSFDPPTDAEGPWPTSGGRGWPYPAASVPVEEKPKRRRGGRRHRKPADAPTRVVDLMDALKTALASKTKSAAASGDPSSPSATPGAAAFPSGGAR